MSRIKLTLSCPEPLAEQVIEYLLDRESLAAGFTTWDAHGHGRDFATASLRERVRGRVQSTMVVVILPSAQVSPLLDELRARFRAPHMVYWTEPVHDFGDFS